MQKEIAEPLNDLKQGLELLKANKTFKCILSTLLSIGIFLNGTPVKGFQIEYLAKVGAFNGDFTVDFGTIYTIQQYVLSIGL